VGRETWCPEKVQQGPSTTVGVSDLGSKQGEFQRKTLQSFQHSTAHSAGLDLATATTVTITDGSVNLISTGVYGPLPHNVCGLLIGHSSTTKSGLFVLPGVIDSDFNGKIKIMVWTPNPPCTIPKGERIAQLILLPYYAIAADNRQRQEGAFGSTGAPTVFWTQKVLPGQPMLTILINGKPFTGLVDTVADVPILNQHEWPVTWPLTQVSAAATGVGGLQIPLQSAQTLLVEGPDKKQAVLKPYVLLCLAIFGDEIYYHNGMLH